MRLDFVDRALVDFVRHADPLIIALTGHWGRGKTHYWREFVLQCEDIPAHLDHYSYVSLFGLQDLTDLKDAIFQNTADLRSVKRTKLDLSLRGRVKDLSPKIRAGAGKLSQFVDGVPKVGNLGPLLRMAAFLTVRDQLICFDDLERRGADLRLEDVLGLANMLREERNCKVIFILNQDELGEKAGPAFRRYREKVFDSEIVFDPTAEAIAEVAFPLDSPTHLQARTDVVSLGIKNLRILFRASRVIGELETVIGDRDPLISRQVVHSSILLTWCYTAGDGAPAYEYVKKMSYLAYIRLPGEEQPSAEEKHWNGVLSSYDYSSTDELDLLICDYLEKGYLDRDQLDAVVLSREGKIEESRLNEAFHEAWQIYYSGFGDDTERLRSALHSSLLAAAHLVSFDNAAATIKLLRDLGAEQEAEELAEKWIQVRLDDPNIDRRLGGFSNEVADEAFHSRAKTSFAESPVGRRSFAETIEALAGQNGWNDEDIEIMAGAPVDEYFRYFSGLDTRYSRMRVEACLRFGQFAQNAPAYGLIYGKAVEALRRIARGSQLNRRRVESYGVGIDQIDHE